ncbi:MAG: RNA-binding transcriptional accessory protein [Bdellovibrionales bacterium]|nr:RNA-binding transcriptional accessory protein [Bdellovibrionales bacterium]
MNFVTWFQIQDSSIPLAAADAVLKLTAEGNTVPFIARYRKEQTQGLDEVGIQKVIDLSERWTEITKRQAFILEEIEKQGKMTAELKGKISSCYELSELEDIYLPYKQKKKTKAGLAKEAGLEPFADWLWKVGHGEEKPQPGQTVEIWALTFRNEEKGFKDADAVIQGATDILIERISESQELRAQVRKAYFETGAVLSQKGDKPKPNSKYENYFEFFEPIESLKNPQNSHRYLAVRRGWIEEELKMSLGGKPTDVEFEKRLLKTFESHACSDAKLPGADVLKKAARLALKAHVIPSIENEVHKVLREIADEAAIKVFAENVRKLLLASPFGSKTVLGVDPGIRTGCKIALVDASGAHMANTVIMLQTEPGKQEAKKMILEVLKQVPVSAVAIGNGTAGRETESFFRALFKEEKIDIPVVMVSEAGASVYSASDVAREEFPDLDLTIRGAISIARRLQDPLAELVKVDPKSIGVGQYQHDVSQPQLKKSLDFVVDSCVNQVGVNLNTASSYLLARIAGIGPSLAKAIVDFRTKTGLFKTRQDLLQVSRFSQKVFEQASGFLRIPNSPNPLDNTGVHPERYFVLEERARALGKKVSDFLGDGVSLLKADQDFKKQLGEHTFKDVISELEKPGRDPREQFIPFQFREDIHEVKDLVPGMICPGIVTNVTNFGAFVDIGVHQDGLVHISQLADKFVKDPRDVVAPGDRVQIKVLEVNQAKNQISLTMKMSEKPAFEPKRSHAGPKPQSGSQRPHGKPSHDRSPDRSDRGDRAGGPSRHQQTSRAPAPAFNNPFGSLAALKGSLKSGK